VLKLVVKIVKFSSSCKISSKVVGTGAIEAYPKSQDRLRRFIRTFRGSCDAWKLDRTRNLSVAASTRSSDASAACTFPEVQTSNDFFQNTISKDNIMMKNAGTKLSMFASVFFFSWPALHDPGTVPKSTRRELCPWPPARERPTHPQLAPSPRRKVLSKHNVNRQYKKNWRCWQNK